MSLALADFQASILGACQGQVNFALRDPTTGAVPSNAQVNAFLNWSIADALFQLGFAPAVLSAVTDTDLLQVPPALIPRVLAVGLLQTKRRIRGQLVVYTQQAGTDKQDFSDLAKQLDREIKDLEADVKARFGIRPAAPAITPMTSAGDPGAGGLYPYNGRGPLPKEGFEFA